MIHTEMRRRHCCLLFVLDLASTATSFNWSADRGGLEPTTRDKLDGCITDMVSNGTTDEAWGDVTSDKGSLRFFS
jgi:hypothetical protein